MRRLLAAAMLAAVIAMAVGPLAGGTGLAQAQTLRIALREDADLLDPTLARTSIGRIVFAGLCDKLFDIDEKLNIVPQLATGYEWADPKTLVLHLRPGVLFQDGEKLDAASVKYSLERHLTLSGSFRRGEISAMDHVDVVDPETVRVVLKTPSGAFLSQLTDRAGMIVSPKAATQEGKDFALHPVCAGPFSFAERVPQDHITLERFPQYWDSKDIHFDKVTYQVIVDSSSRLANLRAGAVNLVEYILPTDAAAVKADPNLRLVMSDALGYVGITNNVANGKRADNPYGKDARVRQAFSLAIDRAALVQVVYNGMYTPAMQAVPASSPFYDADLKPPERDVAKAKALLAAAGVKTPVPLELMVPNSPDLLQAAEVIQSMASEAGFDVHIRGTEFAASLSLSEQGDYEAYFIGWSGRVDIDGNVYAFLHSHQANNVSDYANPTVDNLLDEARGMTDLAKRKALYAEMWNQEAQDLPIAYLWTARNIVGMSAKLQGFRPISDGMIRVQGLELGK
jgi:peptide/nickel transport system substrate-binding protein